MSHSGFQFYELDGRLLRTHGPFQRGSAAEEWLYERWITVADLAVFSRAAPIGNDAAIALLNELLEYRGLDPLGDEEAGAVLTQ